MPELPEVETIVKALSPLAGKAVSSVRVFHEEVLKIPSHLFCRELAGKKLTSLERKGKYILFRFGTEWTMVMHLGMTGQAIVEPAERPDKHTHVRIDFGDSSFYYRDIRKFGFLDLRRFDPEGLREYFNHIGCDPFQVRKENFISLFKKSRARIKPLLLSQKLVSGLGNIYVDETLFRAGISPSARAFRLSRNSLSRYFDVMRGVLREAIKKGGSSIDDYVRPDGSCGSFQECHQVYGKAGQPCPRCGTSIKKIKMGGRGTSFCPRCQK